MLKEKIKILLKNIPLDRLNVSQDVNLIKITAVGNIFLNMTSVQRQQVIYNPLIELITEKHIHAITINTYTAKEWSIKNKQQK
ncbi:putative DNA-binding transcriptional regulator [Buchnera aphidicola (Nipponaphis monzeni)]|uniref:Putative DNA-binding transcriptional regulator n=1 Tax=Buchnera aphidicola (Nipponaphis monzeni) TaxID=2495405 RepID=A0A455TAF5_9GAMM|nr:BolA/IbaG family iron-sulfur metabolism protein [Buchnera aphidicola]BBI01303.1 putative DNA-binding transcriptional regulator [Buchnera aphidicola (Nipponaphis monzeni)]